MPICGVPSGYALFVRAKKDPRTKNTIFSSRRKIWIPVTVEFTPFKVNVGVRDRTNRKYSFLF